MIILTILLVFITGLLLLWLFNQHKYLNIFEQLALGFGVVLSLFVFELFLEGIIFDKLSLIGPVLTFFVLVGILIFKNSKNKGLLSEILVSIKDNSLQIKSSFITLKSWQKIVSVLIVFYVIFKVFMAFSINISMPTFDEDSVAGWDLKTKVFVENKSLVLDRRNSEFLGSALERNIFAPLTDTYFLFGYDKFPVGLSNIIAPLVYLCLIFLFFGIFIRKANLFYSLISVYIFTSLPFIFIHSFGAYFNYISGFFLFTFAFYLSDQVLNLEKDFKINFRILVPLAISSFLDASIRNESIMLMLAIFFIEFGLFWFYNKKDFKFKKYLFVFGGLTGAFIAYLSNIYINYISPQKVGDVSSIVKGGVISNFFESIGKPGVLSAPFIQSFYHTDYNLLYLLYFIAVIIFLFNFKKLLEIKSLFLSSVALLGIFGIILIINVELLGLLTHYAFVRYPIAIIPFLVYIVSYFIHFIFAKKGQ